MKAKKNNITKKLRRVAKRPAVLSSETHKLQFGCGTVYITIGRLDNGKVFEVFMNKGKGGDCDKTLLQTIGRMTSLAIRAGVDIKDIIGQLERTTCNKSMFNPELKMKRSVYSCVDGLAILLGLGNGSQDNS